MYAYHPCQTPPNTLSPRPTFLHKRKGIQETNKSNKQDTIRRGKMSSHQGWIWQPWRVKKSTKNRQMSQRNICSHCWESHKATKLIVITHMQRNWNRPMQAPCLQFQPLWALLSLFGGPCCSLTSTVLHPPLFLELWRRDLMETPSLDTLCIISGCGSLHLFPSAARGSLSDEN